MTFAIGDFVDIAFLVELVYLEKGPAMNFILEHVVHLAEWTRGHTVSRVSHALL
jgi:hypothetical protein